MHSGVLRISYYQEIAPCDSATGEGFEIPQELISMRSDDLLPGSYVGGALQGTFTLDHPSFDRWRKLLCVAALEYEPEDVWSSPDAFSGEPFFELVHCERRNAIGPRTSQKLAQDFKNHEEAVERKLFEQLGGTEFQLFMDIYQLFKKAFQVASNEGCVLLSE